LTVEGSPEQAIFLIIISVVSFYCSNIRQIWKDPDALSRTFEWGLVKVNPKRGFTQSKAFARFLGYMFCLIGTITLWGGIAIIYGKFAN